MQILDVSHKSASPVVISFEDETGSAVSLSGITDAHFAVKEALLPGATPLVSLSLGSGVSVVANTVNVAISPWSALPPGDYPADLLLTISGTKLRSESFLLRVLPVIFEEA